MNPRAGDTAVTIPGQNNYVVEPNGDMWRFAKPPSPDSFDGEDDLQKWRNFIMNVERNPGDYVSYLGQITPNK